jgi:hypothetical protein
MSHFLAKTGLEEYNSMLLPQENAVACPCPAHGRAGVSTGELVFR